MNPAIKQGFDWLWQIKPSTSLTKEQLIMFIHRWQKLIMDDRQKKIIEPEDIDKIAEEIFK